MSQTQRIGVTDSPVASIENDMFSIEKYIRGLSNFISSCETPMTVAIQGDWGSGKTSVMNMVKKNLDDKEIIPIWFNTWQFSQFNANGDVAITFLTYLLNLLSKNLQGEAKNKAQDAIQMVTKIMLKSAGTLTEMLIKKGGDAAKDIVENIVSELTSDNDTNAIEKLRSDFQETVNSLLKETGKERIVIFVDDLDRLQPIRAVELLEILKLFLDCDSCVYVLAIDYEVTSQGITEKYHETLNWQKGRKFFDKIIQVPFKMPVAHYDIHKYVSQTLSKLGVTSAADDKEYIYIIESSVGCNPRGMKRLFNAYLLLQKVHEDTEVLKKEEGKKLLFACLCMQLSYEGIYNYIVLNLDTEENSDNAIDSDFFKNLQECGSLEELNEQEEKFCDVLTEVSKTEGFEPDALFAFMKQFGKLLKGSKGYEIDRLRDVLSLTAVTAGNGVVGKGIRYEKIWDTEFSEHKLNDESVKSFNSCLIEYYSIDGERKECKQNEKIKFVDVFVDCLAYAYQKKKKEFIKLKDYAMQNPQAKKSYRTLFDIKLNKNKSQKEIPGAGISVSTYSSNDAKKNLLLNIYQDLGLDAEKIVLSMREAHYC